MNLFVQPVNGVISPWVVTDVSIALIEVVPTAQTLLFSLIPVLILFIFFVLGCPLEKIILCTSCENPIPISLDRVLDIFRSFGFVQLFLTKSLLVM